MQRHWSHDSRLAARVVMCVLLFPQILSAAILLPLNGYCKPGHYFPIQVLGDDAVHSKIFTAQGCLPSMMDAQTNRRIILPMLSTGLPHELKWDTGRLPLKSPGDMERLIGTIQSDAAATQKLFPGCRLIPINLQGVDLVASPPAAWETLDAIVANAGFFQQLTIAQQSSLLSGGILLAATGDDPPDTHWPWQHKGELWVLHCPIAGSANPVINENAYLPTASWNPGVATDVRLQVMGVAAIFSLVTIALLLRPTRWTAFSIIALALIAAVAIASWNSAMPSANRMGGGIFVQQADLIQRDEWVFERARKTSTQTVGWGGWTHPVFSSVTGLNGSSMRLELAANGDLSFVYQAQMSHTMAFVRRDIQPGELPQIQAIQTSPLQSLAQSDYLIAGDKIVGEISGLPGRWQDVVVKSGR